jgi:outer membrane biosynthesis protein TonB
MEERSPLLQHYAAYMSQQSPNGNAVDHHNQFCHLMGVTPHTLPPGQQHVPHPQSLYARALQRRRNQSYIYALTATLTNGLLLSQVVLGAALTGRVLITVFGALNTIIAGVIAFLKSRGQPLRARMFRDDLDRVVDEIESSAVMWLGISSGVHGYDAIDTDELVTVRSEVARLTRLYDRAVKANTTNDPDLYAAGGPGDFHHAALRQRPEQSAPVVAPQPIDPPVQAPVIQTPVAVEPDDSPATQPPVTQPPAPVALPKPIENPQPVVDESKSTTPDDSQPQPDQPPNGVPQPPTNNETTTPAPAPTPAANTIPGNDTPVNASAPTTPAIEKPDPDASPATAARLPPRDDAKSEKGVDKLSKLFIKSESPFARGMSFQ